jgi:hypothetical protein
MSREIRLNRLDAILRELEYPTTPTAAASECEDVTLVLAEGEVELGNVLRESDRDSFGSAEDLSSAVMSLLPRNAVGEAFQSEGEG